MTIARRLTILLAVPLVALLGLGIFIRLQLSDVEQQSRFVAESRIEALATIGNLSRDYVELRVDVASYLLTPDASGRALIRASFDEHERELTFLLQQYADKLLVSNGGRRLLGEYQTLSREWVAEARQVMTLENGGHHDQAVALLNGTLSETGQRLGKVSAEWIQNNEDLAKTAGKAVVDRIHAFRWKMLVANSLAVVLTGLLGWLTLRRIVRPIRALESSVKTVAAGDYAQAVPFTEATDETGGLARSIDILKQGAAAMDEQRWIKTNAAKITAELQGAASFGEFGERLLSGLVPLLGGGVAGVFLSEENPARLRRIAAFGLAESAAGDTFKPGEGLVGQCAQERKPVVLSDLPPDFLRIASGLGKAAPRQAVAWPLSSSNALLGVIEFASFRAVNSHEQALLDELLPVVAMNLEILQRNLRTQELLTQVKTTEERTRLILESSAEGIFGSDTEGNITFVNPATCRMLGFTAEELIGQPSHATFHHHHADGRAYPKEECPMFAAYTHGKASRVDNEFLWRKDGTSLPVEYSATPILKDGVVIGSVVSFTDITVRKKQEAELQTQHSALEAAANAMAITDRKGIIQWVNPAFERLTGFNREETIGQNPRVLNAGVHDKEFFRNMWQTILAGSVWQGILTNKRKDGVLYQEEMTITPVRSKGGEITHFVAVKQDITERKRAEQALQQANLLSDMALEMTNSGYWHVDYNDPEYYYQSERAARIVGEKIKPDGRYHLQNEWFSRLIEADPELARQTAECYQGAIEGKYKSYDAIYAYKRPADGRIVWLHASGSLVRGEDGKPRYMYGVYQDITEAKKAEAEIKASENRLRETEQFFRSVLELAPDGLMVVDEKGVVQLANAQCEKLFGFTRDEFIGQPVEKLVPDDVRGRHPAMRESFHRSPTARDMASGRELRALRKDGSVFPVEVGLSPLPARLGTGAQVAVSIRDITQRKQQEDALKLAKAKAEEATQMKSMFLANMSHEIRTPMNAIIGLSHLALKTQLTPKQRDYVAKVHNAGTSLLAIINDILDFSKIEAGKLDLETTDFKLDEVISSVTTLTAQKAHDKGLEFLAHVAPGIPEVLLGDPLRLGQILTNFVNNAVKFTERGEIKLDISQVEQTGDKVQLKFAVRDTGLGMTKEQAAKLFQPFTQADMSTTRKHGGTGLGLTICLRLVQLMGGRIWLESEPGVGTTFYFTVWLGVGSATGAGKIVPEKLAQLRVLVVDDNAAAREILQEPLSNIAARVDVVASGKEAIAAVQQHDATDPYDIVFMDWRMPGLDGLQTSRHIKSDETLKHPPHIVLVTAFGREEVREEAERLQLDGFLVKPVTKSMIVDTLVNVFSEAGKDLATGVEDVHAAKLRGAKILLTEDNDINQQIAVELLEGAGASVKVANNGREAVEILANGPQPPLFDVVLMDLQMPEMDGYQATAKLRADARFATLPIIAMTAHATIEEKQRCLGAGMNDHISKPIDPANLFETVGKFYNSMVGRSRCDVSAHAEAGGSVAPLDAARTAQRAVPTTYDLASIEGLDAQDGLARVAGNRKLYLKLLRQFVTQQADAPEQIAAQLQAGDHATAERTAHTVKGVAGNLGAKPVQSAAAELEKAIRERADAAGIETARQRLAENLAALLGGLRPALGEEIAAAITAPATAVDPAQMKAVVAQIQKQLSEFDAAVGDSFEANRALLAALFSAAEFAQFELHLQGYAFGEAQAILEAAAKSRGI